MTKTKQAKRTGKGSKAQQIVDAETAKQDAVLAQIDQLPADEQTAALEQGLPETKPAKAPKVLPTLTEALDAARKDNPVRYALVQSVTELTKDGEPKRVVILCAEPQTKQDATGAKVSVCEGTREIAVQDLFQVRCCAACADRKVRIARRNRTKARNKAARKLLAARKA